MIVNRQRDSKESVKSRQIGERKNKIISAFDCWTIKRKNQVHYTMPFRDYAADYDYRWRVIAAGDCGGRFMLI